jgi:hypothetical protein
MTMLDATLGELFYYSVIRLVVDPLRDEAINIGVIVATRKGVGLMRTRVPRTRVRTVRKNFPFALLESLLHDLRQAAGLASESAANPAGSVTVDRLRALSETMAGQLQLTPPQAYNAMSIEEALTRTFGRYVS